MKIISRERTAGAPSAGTSQRGERAAGSAASEEPALMMGRHRGAGRVRWGRKRNSVRGRSPAGYVTAAVAFAASLTPGLYPRHWAVQGAVSGVALAVGYGLGAGAGALARTAARTPAPQRARAAAHRLAVGAALCIPIAALVWNASWQADVRGLMGIEGSVATFPFAMTPVALVIAALLLLLGRALRAAHRGYAWLVGRALPAPWARRARVLLLLLAVLFVLGGLPLGWTMSALNDMLVRNDTRIDPAVGRPTLTERAGGPGSLIPWETLGWSGRRFVAEGPSVAELEAFSGEPAEVPIRVYVGVRSASTDRERARLAVAELERVGAFERAVLIVGNPTGSGSINSYAIDPLEHMHRGDTAAVAMQYGYLPSWVTMAGNQERAQASAKALFEAVSQRLDQQPAGSRPKLLVYGESLGSFGSESVFSGLGDARARTDGVLWIGPTRGNRLWRDLTAARDPGSPVWKPVVDGGAEVRFGWDGASLLQPGGEWAFPRVAYLLHATDPISWHSPGVLLDRPDWLDPPRGPDISDRMPFIPLVTGLQITLDTALAETAPMSHGHIFGTEQAEAWALVAPPAGWTPERTRALVALLAER